MSIWQALGFWVLASLFVTVVVPVLAAGGWHLYVHLTPAGRSWKAWWDREMSRLKEHEPGLQ